MKKDKYSFHRIILRIGQHNAPEVVWAPSIMVVVFVAVDSHEGWPCFLINLSGFYYFTGCLFGASYYEYAIGDQNHAIPVLGNDVFSLLPNVRNPRTWS